MPVLRTWLMSRDDDGRVHMSLDMETPSGPLRSNVILEPGHALALARELDAKTGRRDDLQRRYTEALAVGRAAEAGRAEMRRERDEAVRLAADLRDGQWRCPDDSVFTHTTEDGREYRSDRVPAYCLFCARIEANDYDSGDTRCVTFEPLNPAAPGHRLFVPRGHITSALDSPLAAGAVLEYAARWAAGHGIAAANFITSAGAEATQTVMHLHVHLIPRSEADLLPSRWPWKVAQ